MNFCFAVHEWFASVPVNVLMEVLRLQTATKNNCFIQYHKSFFMAGKEQQEDMY